MRQVEPGAALPPDHRISAVFLIAVSGSMILAIRSERGWDIPGGHIEPGETPAAALAREVREEAAATFSWAEPCAVLQRTDCLEVMLFYATTAFELLPFSPAADAFEREVIPVDDLLYLYGGPVPVLRQIIEAARAIVKCI